jgi:hypothetical protein
MKFGCCAKEFSSPGAVMMKCSDALGAFSSALAMSEAYFSTLEKHVFQCVPIADRKLLKTWKKTLSGHDALVLLQILWKESQYVDGAELEAAGMYRSMPLRELNANSLAKELAATPEGRGAVNKRISAIVRAGVAFGLIEKKALHAKHAPISGSEKLHEFMLMVAEAWDAIVKDPRDG